MEEPEPLFVDRYDAGRQLAERLRPLSTLNPIVLALPRGGVEVGYQVARGLCCPLDVVVARKLGAPNQPELAIGAIAPDGVQILDENAIRDLRVSPEEIAEMVEDERIEMGRRIALYRRGYSAADIRGRIVILVDDGLATGLTARAAIRSLRVRKPDRLVLAAPVCAAETAAELVLEVDMFVCLAQPNPFGAVGMWYRIFDQTDDETVIRLLELSAESDDRSVPINRI